jgi:hypothetical protein
MNFSGCFLPQPIGGHAKLKRLIEKRKPLNSQDNNIKWVQKSLLK